MNEHNNRSKKKKWLTAFIIYSILLLCILLIANSHHFNKWIGGVLHLFRPILWGLALAYLLNPFFRFFERKLLFRLHPMGLRRMVALVLTYLMLFLIIALLIALIFPQLYASISGFFSNYDSYIVSTVGQFNRILANINEALAKIGIEQNLIHPLEIEKTDLSFSYLLLNMDKIMEWAQAFFANNSSGSLIVALSGFISGTVDMLFAFFISLYLLSTKEKRYAQIMKIRRALFSDHINAKLTKACTIADRSVGGFIEGKLLDSLIIGILAYITMLIFRIPYAVLVATIVGITNVIPFVGPIIGAIPTSIIILLSEPGKVIPFLIIVLVIQQIDGNIIGPKILGNNTGISSLCVLIAITVMGALWGFTGMILGVPLFAIVTELVSDRIKERLRAKGHPSPTENYYPADSIVEPVQDMRGNSDSIVKNLERQITRIRSKEERAEKLTRSDRFWRATHRICRKFHLIPEMTDELITQFTAEESIHRAEEEVHNLIKEARGTDLLDRQP